jgi:hypothetical protein
MNCTLTLPQQQQFYAKVFKDLSVIADNQTSYDLKNYINDFYEQVVAASNDTSLGLTYIQLLPRIVGTIINKNPNIRKHFRDNTISTDDVLDLRDSFEDITNVEKYIRVKELTPDKLEQIRKKAGIVGSQLEKASQTDEDLDFQAKHESGLNTTGQEEEVDADGEFTGEADPNPEKITTFAFIRSIIDRLEKQNLDNANSITIEASNGTIVKGVYMIPVTTYTRTGSAITQLTFATLTKDGYKKLFVNERGSITNVEGEDQAEGSLNPMIDFITPNTINGKRDFIFTGTGETSLAPIDELVERVIKNAALNNLEIPDVAVLKKQFEEKRAQEVKLVDKFIRTYISDKTQVLPLNIIGGNSGFSLIADPGTKLSEIKLPGSLDIEFGKDGRTYIRVGKYSNKIQVFPEKTSSELAQNVAKLLADPKITTAVKFGILEKIYNINDDNFNVTYDNTKKKPVMVIYSGKDEVYNSENPELTDEGFITDVLANVYVNISKENIDGSIQLPDYTSGKLVKRNTPYNTFITRNSKVFVALRNDGSIKFFNPSLQYEFTVDALEQMYPTEKKDEPVVSSTDIKADIEKTEYGTISGSRPLSEIAGEDAKYYNLGNNIFAVVFDNGKIAAIVDKNYEINDKYIAEKAFGKDGKFTPPNKKNVELIAKANNQDAALRIERLNNATEKLNELATTVKPKAKAKAKTVVKNQNVNTTPSGFKGNIDTSLIDDINKSLKRAGFETVNSTPQQIEEIKNWYSSLEVMVDGEKVKLSTLIPVKEAFALTNSDALGTFSSSGITLFTKAGNKDYTTLYHEAWHAFSQLLLSQEQKQSLYNSVRKGVKSLANATDKQVEEYLAEDFRGYVLSDGKKILVKTNESIFQKLWRIIKTFFTGQTDIVDPTVVPLVKQLYDNLRLGNLFEYQYSVDNMQFGKLYRGVDPLNEEETGISLADSNLINESVDGSFSEIIESSGLNVSAIYTDPRALKFLYDNTKAYFQQILDETIARVENDPDGTDTVDRNNIRILEYALDNFGDFNEVLKGTEKNGVIAYHRQKSKYLAFEAKVLDAEEDKSDPGIDSFDRTGNDKSLKELASKQALYMVKSLYQVNSKGEPVKNRLGFNKLVDFSKAWSTVSKTLINSTSFDEIYTKLIELQASFPEAAQLIVKLGNPSESQNSNTNFKRWLGFTQTFNKTVVPIIEQRISVQEAVDEEPRKISTLIQRATSDTNKIANTFRSKFVVNRGKYVIRKKGALPILNINKVLEDFPSVDKYNVFKFLKAIGFYLDDNKTLKNALENSILDRKSKDTFIQYDYIIEALEKAKEDKTIISDPIRFFRDPKLGNQSGTVNKLLTLQARYSASDFNTSIMNPEGNMEYETQQRNSLSQIIDGFNKITNINQMIDDPQFEHLSVYHPDNNPYAKHSYIIKSLFDEAGNRRKDVTLTLENLSGIRSDVNGITVEGIKTNKLNKYDKFLFDVHAIILGATPELPRHASKSFSGGIYMSKYYSENGVDNLILSIKDTARYGHEAAMPMILNYLSAELERMWYVNNILSLQNVDSLKKNGNKIVAFDSVLSKGTKDKLYKLVEDAGSIDDIIYSEELEKDIFKDSLNYFSGQIKTNYKIWTKMSNVMGSVLLSPEVRSKIAEETRMGKGLDKGNKFANDPQAQLELVNQVFTYNSWFNNYETQLFYGDVSQFDDENFHKRNASIASTGEFSILDDYTTNYLNATSNNTYAASIGLRKPIFKSNVNTTVLADAEPNSVYYEHYKNILLGLGVSESRVETILKPYKNIKEGDGQGWVTFDFYRNFLRSLNKWSDVQEELYNQVINDPESVDPRKVSEFFPVLKASYYGPLKTEKLNVSGLHKFSLMPLIPTVIKGTNLEQFHKQLLEQNIAYALYKSGSKISTITLEDGTIPNMYTDLNKRELYTGQYAINPINLNFFKNQLDIAPYFKNKVTLSSQLRTIIETNLYEKGKPITEEAGVAIERYEKSIANYVKYYKQKLFKDVGLEFNASGKLVKGNPKDLIKAIQKELIRLEVPEHQMDILDVNEDGTLKYDFDSIVNSNTIEKQLVAIIERKIVRPTVNGEQLVQVSSSGFEKPRFTKPTDEELLKYGTNGLAFYDIVNGKITAMQVKVALQGDFLKLLALTHTDGKKILTRERLNEMLKDNVWKERNGDAIKMIGVRIPVQGLNSIEYMEIAEFLPTEAGSIVIVPTELVAKSGGDFDIDKLSIIMPNINISTNELLRLEEESGLDLSDTINFEAGVTADDTNIRNIENEILKSMIGIMELKENFLQLITPNETDIVKPIADELAKYNREYDARKKTANQDPSFKTISPTRIFETEYNLYKHESNNIGKITLGIGAVSNKYSVILNRVGAYLNQTYTFLDNKGKTKTGKNRILLKHNKTDKKISLSDLKSEDAAHYISDVISQLMNGWVDIEKDSWVFDMNAVYELSPVLLYMLQAGVNVETAAYFLSQPMIRDYISTYRVLTGMYSKSLDTSEDSSKGAGFLKYKAKNYIINKYGIFDEDHKAQLKKLIKDPFLLKQLYQANTGKNPLGGKKSITPAVDIMVKAYNVFAISDENIKNIVETYNTKSPLAKLSFLHFLELEDQSKVMREISSATNVDTKKSGNLFQAKSRISKIEDLEGGARLPEEVTKKIQEQSSIAPFFIQDYILNLFKDYFPLRASDKINGYLTDLINNNYNDIYENYGNIEKFVELFRNDLLQFIVQNSIGSVNINTIKDYKGYSVNDSITVEKVRGLKRSAVYSDGVIYIDRAKLRDEYNKKTYSKAEYEETGLAKLPADRRTDVVTLFTSEKQYAAFVLEREYLRGTREQGDLENDLYESSLVNDALANTYNLKTMFFGINSFPDKYEAIKSIVGEDKYLLFNYLVYDSQAIKSAGKNTVIKNLRLTGDVKDPDFLESLNSEFEELSDVTVTKVSDPMLNREISEFFQKLSVYGFMQSGMNASYLSFVPILSSNNFKDIIKTNIDEFSKVIDGENGNTALYRYNQVFEKQNSRKNNIKYRFKNYVIDSVISKMGDPIPKLPEGTSSTMTPRVYTFKYNKMGTIGYINKYSGLIGVYNGAKDGSGTNVIASDTYMGNTNKVTGTTVPLPIFESYVGKPNYLSSANAADNIKLVQDSIAQLVEMYEAGKTLLFNQDGYGIFSDDNNIDRSAYVELSKELYYNFGYLNPVFEKDPDFMEYIYSVQPINQIFNEDPETAPDQEDDIVEEKEITLIDGNNYPASAINSEMLENMGYDEDTIGEILKQICG